MDGGEARGREKKSKKREPEAEGSHPRAARGLRTEAGTGGKDLPWRTGDAFPGIRIMVVNRGDGHHGECKRGKPLHLVALLRV